MRAMNAIAGDFGGALRWWRTARRFSQLRLALEAEVSSRHISFLETGRANPSREMVVHLGIVLDLPLRDRNALLNAAGFAPLYPCSGLDAPQMGEVRAMLRGIVDAHAPHPSVVVDRLGDIIDANDAALMLIEKTVAADSPARAPVPNVNRLTFHPAGIRCRTRDWHALAADVLQRLEREYAFRPTDEELGALVTEMLSYPEVVALRRDPGHPTGGDLLALLHIETRDDEALSLMTTIATIGAPYGVTLDELRLETFFPANAETKATLIRWASTPSV